MTTFLIVLHVIVCIFLIAVVLLQRGRGAEIGAVFGGGASSTVFGSRGAGSFLSKLTTISAAIFMLTSLALAYVFSTASQDRLFQEPGTGLESEAAAPTETPLFEEVGEAPAAETTEGALPALPEPGKPEAGE